MYIIPKWAILHSEYFYFWSFIYIVYFNVYTFVLLLKKNFECMNCTCNKVFTHFDIVLLLN